MATSGGWKKIRKIQAEPYESRGTLIEAYYRQEPVLFIVVQVALEGMYGVRIGDELCIPVLLEAKVNARRLGKPGDWLRVSPTWLFRLMGEFKNLNIPWPKEARKRIAERTVETAVSNQTSRQA